MTTSTRLNQQETQQTAVTEISGYTKSFTLFVPAPATRDPCPTLRISGALPLRRGPSQRQIMTFDDSRCAHKAQWKVRLPRWLYEASNHCLKWLGRPLCRLKSPVHLYLEL